MEDKSAYQLYVVSGKKLWYVAIECGVWEASWDVQLSITQENFLSLHQKVNQFMPKRCLNS